MGVTINSVSTGRHAGAEYLVLDSGAQIMPVQSGIQDKRYRCLILEHDSTHAGGRLVTYKLPGGRTFRVLFHACAVQRPILSLGCLAQ